MNWRETIEWGFDFSSFKWFVFILSPITLNLEYTESMLLCCKSYTMEAKGIYIISLAPEPIKPKLRKARKF